MGLDVSSPQVVCQPRETETDRRLSGDYVLAQTHTLPSKLIHGSPPDHYSPGHTEEQGNTYQIRANWAERCVIPLVLASAVYREALDGDKLSIMRLLASRYLAPVSHH